MATVFPSSNFTEIYFNTLTKIPHLLINVTRIVYSAIWVGSLIHLNMLHFVSIQTFTRLDLNQIVISGLLFRCRSIQKLFTLKILSLEISFMLTLVFRVSQGWIIIFKCQYKILLNILYWAGWIWACSVCIQVSSNSCSRLVCLLVYSIHLV